MSKYLITGGEGFIGSRIASETGGILFDIRSGFDILDTQQLEEISRGTDGIFHCAAKISVPESMSAPAEYYRTNVEGAGSVVEVAERCKLKIVFSSSAAVYGETSVVVSEKAGMNPKSPYAENKRDGENLLKAAAVAHIALRYFNVYGPGQSAQYAGVITAFISNALRGDDLLIYGDGNQVRDFVFVSDVARANVMAMEYKNKNFEIFNIGTGIETTIRQLAEMIVRLTRSTSKIVYRPSRPGDIVYSRADVSKAENILQWKAETSLETGLSETILYYKNRLSK